MNTEESKKSLIIHKTITIVGIVLCVILIPILLMNCILLVKGWTNDEEVPNIGGLFPMIVLTNSMEDEFGYGSMIFCKQVDPKELKVDDVITFFPVNEKGEVTSQITTTHRIIEILEDGDKLSFRTQGDNNDTPDGNPVPAENVIGRYTDFHIEGLGNLALFMQSTTGLIVCVFLPLLIIVGYDIIRRQMYDKKHAEDKDELMKELEELRKLKASQKSEE